MASVLDSESLQSNGITFSRQVMQPKQLGKLLGHEAEVLARRLTNFHKFAPQKEARVCSANPMSKGFAPYACRHTNFLAPGCSLC